MNVARRLPREETIERLKSAYENAVERNQKQRLEVLKTITPMKIRSLIKALPDHLSERNSERFLKRVDENKSLIDSALARLILHSSYHINTEEFLRALEESVNNFLKVSQRLSGPWYLWLPSKVGSEYLVSAMALSFLRDKINFVGAVDESWIPRVREYPNIVVVDDALFTGYHQLGTFDQWLEEVPVGVSLHIHFLIPFSTCSGVANLEQLSTFRKGQIKVSVYPVRRLNTLKDLIQCQEKALKNIRHFEDLRNIKWGVVLLSLNLIVKRRSIRSFPHTLVDISKQKNFSTFRKRYLNNKTKKRCSMVNKIIDIPRTLLSSDAQDEPFQKIPLPSVIILFIEETSI